ncbi:MAG: murein biosynthesis integral membrane protein MurJ [Anaerolineae bacterium]|jgi:putative peptidoglycan lipid II flippase
MSQLSPQSNGAGTSSGLQVARSAALIAAMFAADKVLGIGREMAVGRAFGTSAALDAYIAAFEVPEGLNVIVTGAALTTSLIPLLTAVIEQENRESLWRFISTVVNWILIVVGGFSIVAAIFAHPIILALAPGFADDPAQVTLATQLMRLVLIQTLIFSVSTIFTGTLQAHRHFFLPALGPLLYTLGRIFGAVVLAPQFGIFGLAWGGLIGATAHLLVKLPWLVRHRARWVPALFHPQFPHLIRLMAPRMLGMGATYVNFVLPTTLGSRLADGAIASYEYGWKLMQLPETLLGTALGIAVLPTLSAIASRGERDELRRTFSWTLRVVLALAIPAAAGLVLLGRPLTALVFQRGAFDAAATERVYWGLQFFALGLIGHSALEVVARLFYARRDMWTPLWAALAGLATNAGLGWLLLSELSHGAIALSNSLGACLQVAILLIVAQDRLGGIGGRAIGRTVVRTLVATAVMAAAILGVRRLIPGAGTLMGTALEVGFGAITYVAVAALLGSQVITELPRRLIRR